MAKSVKKPVESAPKKTTGKPHRKPNFPGINSPIDAPKGYLTHSNRGMYGKLRDAKGKSIEGRPPVVGPKSHRGYISASVTGGSDQK